MLGSTTVVALLLSAFTSVIAIVPSVPYHRQITDYYCGDASFQMTLQSFNLSAAIPSQNLIAKVMRTTEEQGTLSYDVVRAGHFSLLSTPPYGSDPDQHGWNSDRLLGMASYSRRQDTCWSDDLKTFLQEEKKPMILLMYYSSEDHGGHFRVAIDYIEAQSEDEEDAVKLLDPWDRDGQPHVVLYNVSEFCSLWAHQETNGPDITYKPYFGAMMSPWETYAYFEANQDNVSVTLYLELTYWCPEKIVNCDAAPAAENVVVILHDEQNPSGHQIDKIGKIMPGQTTQFSLKYFVPKEGTKLTLITQGTVSAQVPTYYAENGTVVYEAYDYKDIVGGYTTLVIPSLFFE